MQQFGCVKNEGHTVSVSQVFSHRVSLSTGLKKGYSRVGIYTTRDLLLPTFFPPICSVCLLAAGVYMKQKKCVVMKIHTPFYFSFMQFFNNSAELQQNASPARPVSSIKRHKTGMQGHPAAPYPPLLDTFAFNYQHHRHLYTYWRNVAIHERLY